MFVWIINVQCYSVEHSKRMEEVLPASEVTVARSFWPLKDKKRLNKFQQRAIDLAWGNKFTMIQGPPGMKPVEHLVGSNNSPYCVQAQERV